jgi:DNA-binding transcriptional MerR regulator
MAEPTADDAEAELGWGVGSVAARLGIAASTLRTWERRYDVGPSRRTAGGHRRYTELDIERVQLTQMLIARGAPPADAARVAHALDDEGLADAIDAESDHTQTPAGRPSEVVTAMLDAAMSDDPRLVGRLVGDALRAQGVVAAWDDIISPTLVRIGREWAAGRFRLEAEHLASEAIGAELRAHARRLVQADRELPTIILAGAENDEHALPVFAVEAALAERGVEPLVLGARLPAGSLASVTQRVRPCVIFLWASLPRAEDETIWDVLVEASRQSVVLLGGPGWPTDVVRRKRLGGALDLTGLGPAVERILEASGHPDPYSPVT